MLSEEMKKRVYADALEAEAELIERDLTIETVREWLGELDDMFIDNLISVYRGQLKATLHVNRNSCYNLIGEAICHKIEHRVMDAAAEQLEGKDIYHEDAWYDREAAKGINTDVL